MRGTIIYILISFAISQNKAQTWQWAKSGNGLGANEGFAVTADINGNSLITGEFTGTTCVFGSYTLNNVGSSPQYYIVKYDPNGNVLWAQSAGGSYVDQGLAIATDPSGNVLVTGSFDSPTIVFGTFTLTNSTPGTDVFLVKYNSAGNVLWAYNPNGPGGDLGYGVCSDASGNIFLSGAFTSSVLTFGTYTLTNPNSNFNMFLAKFDPSGNILWAKGAGGQYAEFAYSVATDAPGNVYVTGYFSTNTLVLDSYTLNNSGGTPPASEDIFIAKYDSNGNVLWAKNAGGNSTDKGYSVSTDTSGNCFVCGTCTSPTVVAGTFSLTNGGLDDAFVIKYSLSGNELWAKSIKGTGEDAAFSCSSFNNNVYIVGAIGSVGTMSNGGVPVVVDTSTLIPPPNSTDPIFLIELDASGTVIYTTALQSGGDDLAGLAVDPLGNLFISGDFTCNQYTFGTHAINLTGMENIFIAKLNQQPDAISERNYEKRDILVGPNPNNGYFELNVDDIEGGKFILINSTGQKIHEQKIIQGINEIKTSGLSAGLYNFILFENNQQINSGRLLIE